MLRSRFFQPCLALSVLSLSSLTHGQGYLTDPWPQYAGNAQHTAVSKYSAQPINRIIWQVPIDQNPQYSGVDLLIHYTPPLLSQGNTVVIPIKTQASNGYVLTGLSATDGSVKWSIPSNYMTSPDGWTPVCGCALIRKALNQPTGAVVADSGGRLIYRPNVDIASSAAQSFVYYGADNYAANPSAYDANVFINTPITVDSKAVSFFGVQVTGSTPLGLSSCLVRMQPNGIAQYKNLSDIVPGYGGKIQTNSAPAISNDGKTVYVALNGDTPMLIGVDSQTLALKYSVELFDPVTLNPAVVIDEGTASPMVGPDGSVFFGILENPWYSNNDRGYMLHFNGKLQQLPYSGQFGWDDTASIVPRSAVPGYTGNSSYLILTKYNNYYGIGSGDGHDKVAVLDPNAPLGGDPTSPLMAEVMTVEGVTPDPGTDGGVREWCINSAVVDPAGKCAILNSEDGTAYKWDFITGTLTQHMALTAGIGEAYTTTLLGPNGHSYAISNGILFVLGS